jgi:hypothetical protein
VDRSTRSVRKARAPSLLAAVALALAGCAPAYAEVWVRNERDGAFTLHLRSEPGSADRFVAIPARSQGIALRHIGRPPTTFVLLSAECRPVAGGAITADAIGLVIDEGGVDIRADPHPEREGAFLVFGGLDGCREAWVRDDPWISR